jgi:hypothetical protein
VVQGRRRSNLSDLAFRLRMGRVPPFNPHEVTMSADKDRAIRRQKQKRAKHLKKNARQQPADAPSPSTKGPAQQKAA